ncbi:MAG: hypothetical protein SCJ94_05015 [Bacillota bacterium]|nr:hypothetical protein [Bacillota bacterium]MDW7729351.1 hypothetical protein [Bacillota bacterium]
MTWQKKLKGDSLFWLLEKDNPGVRYLALQNLLDTPSTDIEMITAKSRIYVLINKLVVFHLSEGFAEYRKSQ